MAQPSKDFSRAAHLSPRGLWWLKRLGRLAAIMSGTKQLEGGDYEAGPAVYAANHGPTLWGALDWLVMADDWYNRKQRPDPLFAISEDFLFETPVLGRFAAAIGLRRPDPKVLGELLDAGASIVVPAGGNTDLLKPVWMKNFAIFARLRRRNGHYVPQYMGWFLRPAVQRRVTLRCVAISGTAEMTPVLATSRRMFRWLGFEFLRSGQDAPGYPIMVNHFVNLGLFLLVFPNAGIVGWAVFLVLNTYADPLLSYPVLWRRVRGSIGEKIEMDATLLEGASAQARQRAQDAIVLAIMKDLNRQLSQIEASRTDLWSRLWLALPGKNVIVRPLLQKLQSKFLGRYNLRRELFL